jgi:hypothetical protein
LHSKLSQAATQAERPDQASGVGPSSRDIARILRALLGAVEGEPVPTDLTWPVNRKRVRIDGIEIGNGALRLHVVPVDRAQYR